MYRYLSVLAIILISSCELGFPRKDERMEALNEMQQTDVEFAEMAFEKGYRKAFMEYMEDDAVLLRDNHLPIIGADAVQYVSSIDDTSFTVNWDPQGGDVSGSGDMGFTYGVYEIRTETERQKGTYVTIWRKQKDGRWKYVLDAGAQGIGDEQPKPVE
jgi:ketosteroid isomerase-like protein